MKTYRVENITKTYGEKTLFSNISFSINTKEIVGLIGINGTGKSSLIKCIAGIDNYDSGEIIHPNDYTIGYLSQDTNLDENKTVLDCIFDSDAKIMKLIKEYEKAIIELEKDSDNKEKQDRLLKIQETMDKEGAWDASSNAKTILSKLGINYYEEKISNLSGGQKKRVALAQVLIESPDLLLLDEPTNHLDFDTIEWLEKYLKNYPNAILVITHDRYFLDNISTKTFELDKGNIYEYQGNYSYFLEKKIEREANEAARYLKEKKLYKKELEWIRSGVKARTTKQQARINRFEQLEDKLDNTQISNNDMSINLNNKRLGKQVFEIENISKKYNDKQIINKLDLIITNKARIGIIGKNGVGKSTFLNILSDDTKVDSGNIKKGETVKIAYYNQFSYDMNENKRIINYIRESAEIIRNSDGSVTSAAQLLEQFLFPMHTHGTLIKKLSGGEKRRLYLLKLLMGQPNVLLLDEPTNDLDTQTLTILEEYLENFSGSVITVSHDRYFLDKVVSELLVFKGDANIIKFTGNYSEYISSGGTLSNEKEESFDNKKESNYTRNNKKVKMTYNEKREWENIEKEIEILEDNLSSIEAKMVEEATDFVKLNELELERKSIKEKLDLKLERWEYLSELAESI